MLNIENDISLYDQTSFKLKSTARYFLKAITRKEIVDGIEWARKNKIPYVVLGSASNVVFGSDIYQGLVIKNAWTDIRPATEKGAVYVSSGTDLATVVEYFVNAGFGGLEWAGGLPGTIGGAVRGNAGAFGGEIKDCVISVESMAFSDVLVVKKSRDNKECSFGYRNSIFKQNGEIIMEVMVGYKKSSSEEIRKVVDSCKNYRKQKLPLEYPSAGSFFKNIPVETVPAGVRKYFASVTKNDPLPLIPAAAVIADLDLIGRQIGGAQISQKHPNFIINKENATSVDIFALAEMMEHEAFKKYAIKLEREVQMIL
ncbi:MAG: UDP-N-acetylmuramate dehydrogenase [Endomicrobiales bacterium]